MAKKCEKPRCEKIRNDCVPYRLARVRLLKAIPDSLDDGVLLFRGHLVVAREAKPACEDVGSGVRAFPRDVGVGAGAAVALRGHEGVAHVHGLHVHGFPDGAAFGVHGGDFLEDFGGAALAGLVDIQRLGAAANLPAHGVLVDNHAAEPEVRHGIHDVVGVHLHGQSLEPFAVAFVYGAFLGDVLLEVGHLAADHSRDDVAHAVVVADFLVLVPGGGLAGLRAPLAHLLGVFPAVGEEHAAARAGDDLVAVEADGAVVAELAGLYALVGGAKALGGVFDKEGAVLFADGADFVDLAGRSVQVDEHHQAHVGIDFKSFFECSRVHVPGIVLGVDEHGLAVLVGDGIDRRVEGHVAAEYLAATQSPLAQLGHTVEGLARELGAEVQRSSARGKRDGVLAAHLLGGDSFQLVDVRADGAHPIGFVGLGHVLDFVTVHRGTAEPDFLFETGHINSLFFAKYKIISPCALFGVMRRSPHGQPFL